MFLVIDISLYYTTAQVSIHDTSRMKAWFDEM